MHSVMRPHSVSHCARKKIDTSLPWYVANTRSRRMTASPGAECRIAMPPKNSLLLLSPLVCQRRMLVLQVSNSVCHGRFDRWPLCAATRFVHISLFRALYPMKPRDQSWGLSLSHQATCPYSSQMKEGLLRVLEEGGESNLRH